MPTPAYTPYDSTKPSGADTPTQVVDTEIINNERSLRDMAIVGGIKGYVQTRTQGTGADLAHPQFITWINGTLGFRWNMTWTGDKVTGITYEWSNDQGSTNTWVAMSTAQVNTYDASFNLTASTNSGGYVNVLLEVWSKLMGLITTALAHIAGTGTAVHGLGTASTQNTASFPATGTSTLDGTGGVGQTTPPPVDATRVRENFHDYGAIGAGGTVTLEMDKYSHFSFTPNSTTSALITVAFSGAPASGKTQSFIIEVVNGKRDVDGRFTWDSHFHWIGGSAARPHDDTLELSGRNLFSCVTHDAGANIDIVHLGKRG